MFEGIRDMAATKALNGIKNVLPEKYLQGICEIESISWRNGSLFLKLKLDGLDVPVECEGADICVSRNGDGIRINKFKSNLPFLQTALNRFVAGKVLAIPPGGGRLALKAARVTLGL